MKKYTTSEVAKFVKLHSNTIRLYESLGIIPSAKRDSSNYREFSEFHIEQIEFARLGFQIELLQKGLRKKIIDVIKLSAQKKFIEAEIETDNYINQLEQEITNAEEAITIVQNIIANEIVSDIELFLKRGEVATYLDVTVDTLRNWELNGLIKIKKKKNGYRIYESSDIKILKVIRTLRYANYSLSSILRLLSNIDDNSFSKMRDTLAFHQGEDVITACDNLIVSLQEAMKNAIKMRTKLEEFKIKYPPL